MNLGNRTITPTTSITLVGAPGTHQGRGQHGLPANTQMWLVDFDKCNRVCIWEETLTKDIRRLALGICANDPYYPNPLPDTRQGWDVFLRFTEAYIRAGRRILQHASKKVATNDEQMEHILQRPVLVMREWTKIVWNTKRQNERDIFEQKVRIHKEERWVRPVWFYAQLNK